MRIMHKKGILTFPTIVLAPASTERLHDGARNPAATKGSHHRKSKPSSKPLSMIWLTEFIFTLGNKVVGKPEGLSLAFQSGPRMRNRNATAPARCHA